jgi:hypothetical protein
MRLTAENTVAMVAVRITRLCITFVYLLCVICGRNLTLLSFAQRRFGFGWGRGRGCEYILYSLNHASCLIGQIN